MKITKFNKNDKCVKCGCVDKDVWFIPSIEHDFVVFPEMFRTTCKYCGYVYFAYCGPERDEQKSGNENIQYLVWQNNEKKFRVVSLLDFDYIKYDNVLELNFDEKTFTDAENNKPLPNFNVLLYNSKSRNFCIGRFVECYGYGCFKMENGFVVNPTHWVTFYNFIGEEK